MCVFVHHTRNSRNRVHIPSTGEELSRYSADDPRGARAVWQHGVIGPELDDETTSKSLTTGQTSLASSFSRRVNSDGHRERILHNVQRHAAIACGQFVPSQSCFTAVTLF